MLDEGDSRVLLRNVGKCVRNIDFKQNFAGFFSTKIALLSNKKKLSKARRGMIKYYYLKQDKRKAIRVPLLMP